MVGAAHVGQNFRGSPIWLWDRPSAASALTSGQRRPYNALASGASNLGPTNPELLAHIRCRLRRLLAAAPGESSDDIPPDLVESSGSGLDPDITVQAALVQVARVARATRLPPALLRALVWRYETQPALGLFGPPRVNVLRVNLALAQLLGYRPGPAVSPSPPSGGTFHRHPSPWSRRCSSSGEM